LNISKILKATTERGKEYFLANEKRLSIKERFGPPSILISVRFFCVDKALAKTVKKVEDNLAIFKV
jgi:hypothetical protein